MSQMKKRDLYAKLYELNGRVHQTAVAIEELSELQKELCKSIRGKACDDNIIEEIADSLIMIEQIIDMNDITDAVAEMKRKKLVRLQERLEGDNAQ